MIAHIQQLRSEHPRRWSVLIAVVIASAAMTIRLVGLGAESGWIDEAYSISLARFPLNKIIQGTAADQHPPLYYLLLHVWMLFGDGIPFARLLSVLIGTIHVILVLILGWQVGGEKLGIGAAILLAVSPLHVWYSQEARQYMLLACLTTVATLVLWQTFQGRHGWVWYWLFSTLAMYTQYFAVFILLAHAILVGIWAWRKRSWRPLLSWGAAMLGIGLAFTPWLRTAIDQFMHHSMSWIGDPFVGDVLDVALRLLFGSGVLALPVIFRWVGLLGLLGVAAWTLLRIKSQTSEMRWGLTWLAIWAMVPFIAITWVAIFYPVFQFKQYLILLAPFLLTATGIALVIPRTWGRLFYAGLVIAAGLTLAYQQTNLTKDDWRGVAETLNKSAAAGDLVYGNPAASSLALKLYEVEPLLFAGYPPDYDILKGGWDGELLNPQLADSQLSEATQDYQRVWLLEFSPEFWDAQRTLEAWLTAHGTLVDDQTFGNIHLRLYQLNP